MMDNNRLRQELADLLSRIKPQHLWSGAQDYFDQRAIAKRAHLIQTYLANHEAEAQKE